MLPVGAAEAPATIAAVPMEMDQGATWHKGSLLSPSPLVQYLGGKRLPLKSEDDGDERERAENSLLEDVEAGPRDSALRTSGDSALPDSFLSVDAHNLHRFTFVSLRRHRDSRHRRISFHDRFSAGCACGIPFVSMLAAARHALACGRLEDTLTAAAPPAGDLSPTDDAVCSNATVADQILVMPIKTQRCSLCPPTYEHHCRQVYVVTMERPTPTIISCVAHLQGSCHTLGGTSASQRGGVKDRRSQNSRR
ncbi:hypothetical protein PsorP6_013604 [Peronosclerospora sorghi]|uniref:Uncharacterized protein n=1 Tax=Peronosclerospora sorghi TaxID=230839 RepID=A0ACC0VGC2_9STRA|nr:hypothetical protein PsorP6_013604 [Peronosclerospora sorghi]